jgi:hypothetical protein
MNLSEKTYTILKREQKRRVEKISLKQLAASLIEEAINYQSKLGTFEKELNKHVEVSENKDFLEYLNSPLCGELIRLLDQTRPTYQDIAAMSAMLIFLKIKSREFFKVIVTYARYGLSQMQEETE